jgi:class 3 adenylate cyclase
MAISRWTKARLQIVAVVAAIGTVAGIAISWLLSQILEFPYDFAQFELGARSRLTVGGALAALDLFYVQGPPGAWLRRMSFGRMSLLRASLFTAVIIACFALNRLIFGLLYGFERAGLDYFGLPLLRDTTLGFIIFLAISEFLQMRRVIGGRTLNNLLLGRYHRPVREERVFILVDIKGSTALAERLGDRRAHAFITSVFFDIDQPILEHGGEVYNYVGDELIASWPVCDGVDDARCVHCALAIQDTLARRADDYCRIFGSAPAVRIVLHAGPVVAGECGGAKLAIVYLGDTLNTAARIEETAKALRRNCLISDVLLARIDLPPSLGIEPLGSFQLRGRQQPITLYALHRATVPGAASGERSPKTVVTGAQEPTIAFRRGSSRPRRPRRAVALRPASARAAAGAR